MSAATQARGPCGRWGGLALWAVLCWALEACGAREGPEGAVDRRLELHEPVFGAVSVEARRYLEEIAKLQARAEQSSALQERLAWLRDGLAEPVPAGLGEAELVQLELEAAVCETLLALSESEQAVLGLRDRLSPSRSLPSDVSSARALICLGDAARASGRDGLAVGSYARALDLLAALRLRALSAEGSPS